LAKTFVTAITFVTVIVEAMGQSFCLFVLATLTCRVTGQREFDHLEREDSIDWHEWITDDEHRDSPGSEMLSWSSHQAWGTLLNGSSSSTPPTTATRTTRAPRPPVFLLAGIASTRLVNWREKQCRGSNIKARDVVWVNIGKLVETKTIDPTCWVDCMKVGPQGTDLDQGCVLRPDEGLDSVSAMAPGPWTSGISQVYAPLISLLVEELGYTAPSSLRALPYDWRLAPRRLEERDGFMSATKQNLELAVSSNGRPAVVIAHSMGNLVFLYFLEWLRKEHFPNNPKGFQGWVDRHVWCYVGLSAPLLGAAGALRTSLDGETFGLPLASESAREMELTFDSTHWLNPRKVPHHGKGTGQGRGGGGGGLAGRLAAAAASGMAAAATAASGSRSSSSNGGGGSGGGGGGGHGRSQHASRRGDWPRDLVRVRPDPDSNRSLAFGVADIAVTDVGKGDGEEEGGGGGGGGLFAWLAEREEEAFSANVLQKGTVTLLPTTTTATATDPACTTTTTTSTTDPAASTTFAASTIALKRLEAVRRKHSALRSEYSEDPLGNPLHTPPARPPVKHVIMAYGVDLPTDVGYRYVAAEKLHTTNHKKKGKGGASSTTSPPTTTTTTGGGGESGIGGGGDPRLHLEEVVVEEAGGSLTAVRVRDASILVKSGSGSSSSSSSGGGGGRFGGGGGGGGGGRGSRKQKEERVKLKRGERKVLRGKAQGGVRVAGHSGDGTVPYLSLSWAHTWLEDESVPSVKLSTHGPVGSAAAAATEKKSKKKGNSIGEEEEEEEASSSPSSSSQEGGIGTGIGGWTIFGFGGGGGSGGNRGAATTSNGFSPLSAAASGGRTLWQRTSTSSSSSSSSSSLSSSSSSKLSDVGTAARTKTKKRKNILGSLVGACVAVVRGVGQNTARLLLLLGRGRKDGNVGQGGRRRIGDGDGGGSGSGSGVLGADDFRDGGATTTTVLEIEGAMHTALTTDPGALAVVLAHVLRHMDDDLALAPATTAKAATAATPPASSSSGRSKKKTAEGQKNERAKIRGEKVEEQIGKEREASTDVAEHAQQSNGWKWFAGGVSEAPHPSRTGVKLKEGLFSVLRAKLQGAFATSITAALAPVTWPFHLTCKFLTHLWGGLQQLFWWRARYRTTS
jgi:hypothetical protein